MRRRTSAPLALAALLPVLLAGCGGSGNDNNGTPNPNPNPDPNAATVNTAVDVTWSDRSRDFFAPSAALSARITFLGGSAAGTDVTTVVDRRDDPAGYSTTYALPAPVRLGGATIRVDFFAQKGAGGALVATAESGAIVRPDGTLTRASGQPLGFLAGQSEIASVSIVGPDTLAAGATAQYGFTALNRQGQAIALTPGSGLFSASSNIEIAADGSATGRFPGEGQVTVSVNSVRDTKTVTVTQATSAAVIILDQPANTVAYSPAQNRVLVTVPGNAPNGNTLLTLDPATGALDGVYRVGSAPNALGVSADGSVVYVGLDGSAAVRRVDLSTGAVGAPFSLGTTSDGAALASDIAVSPTDPNTIAVAQGASSFRREIVLYRNGVPAANRTSGFYENSLLAFSDNGANVFGLTLGSSSERLTKNAVDANGVTFTTSADNRLSNDLLASEGRLYGLNGQVISADTLANVGRFQSSANFPEAFTVSPVARRAYFLVRNNSSDLNLETFDLDTFALLSTQTLPNVASSPTNSRSRRLSVAGPNRLAYIGNGDKLFLIDLTKL